MHEDYDHGFLGFPNAQRHGDFILYISLLYYRLPQIWQNLQLTSKLAQKKSKKSPIASILMINKVNIYIYTKLLQTSISNQ